MSHTAPQRPDAAPGETRNVSVSFAEDLDVGELLTGTPTVVDNSPPSPEELAITNIAVSTGSLTINDITVPTGEAVTFSVSGFVADTDYIIKITADTDSTPAQTLIGYVKIDAD